jgi:Asp/Glu/hydantoin racemase
VTHRAVTRRLVYLEGVTYAEAEVARRRALMTRHLSPGFTIDVVVPPDGPAILERAPDFEQLRQAELGVVARLTREDCGAIVAAGAVDPNLEDLRAAAHVPVVGPGEASLFMAASSDRASSFSR